MSEIAYDRKGKGCKLMEKDNNALMEAEIFSVIKIILDSKVLSRTEINTIVTKLLYIPQKCLHGKRKAAAPFRHGSSLEFKHTIFHQLWAIFCQPNRENLNCVNNCHLRIS